MAPRLERTATLVAMRRARSLGSWPLAALVLVVVGVIAGALLGLGGESSGAPKEADEPTLDGSVPAARQRARDPETAGRRPRVVRVVPPGGVREEVDEKGEEKRLRAENVQLREDLDDLRVLEKARKRVQRQLAKAGYDSPLVIGAGGLAWPVRGPIVSPFGPRGGRLHAGIDIAAPAGRPIRAAEAGRVVIRGVVGGYGNYVCVAHSREFTTCYAHLSRFATEKGRDVEQGEVIGLVGCTGRCFGDHLHFETYVRQRPVDPMPYL